MENKNIEKNINDKQVQYLSWLFSVVPKKIKTEVWERYIYDLPTQYFIFWSHWLPIYWEFKYKMLVNKIIKEQRKDNININNIDDNTIDNFRNYFYKNPEFKEDLNNIVDEWDEVKIFNEFMKYTIEFKILKDEDLNPIREIRAFLFKNNVLQDNTWDLYYDLYNFLDFSRFERYLPEQEYKSVLLEMIEDIQLWNIRNPLDFRKFSDWDDFTDEYLEKIEKLVLMNYTLDPLTHKLKEKTCDYIKKFSFTWLRKILWFKPKWWQRQALVMESRENLAANSRRSWKSYLAIYIAIRQIMLPQQMILYVLPNKEWFSEQPFAYIEQFFDNISASLEWTDLEIEWKLPNFQFNNKTFKVTNKEMKSKIIFISSVGGTKWGRSFSSNLIIFDEAWYTDDPDIYDTSMASTTDKRWRMWAISTINKDTPINWFFYKKIDLEWEMDSQVLVVDIWWNDFIPHEEKLRLQNQNKHNKKIWLSEYMAIFVWQWSSFDMTWFFRIDFDYDVYKFWDFSFRFTRKLDKYKKFLINRDPWRDIDPWWVTVIWIKWPQEADIICSWYMKIPNYIVQANAIIEIYEFLKKMKPSDIVLDLWKAGIWMYDYMKAKWYYPYWVTSTWGNTINDAGMRKYNISNTILEGNLKNIMNTWILKWFSWLEWIMNEYETFEASKTRSWTNHHHDILSSLMIWVTIWLEKWFMSFRKQQAEAETEQEYIERLFRKDNNNMQKWVWQFLY